MSLLVLKLPQLSSTSAVLVCAKHAGPGSQQGENPVVTCAAPHSSCRSSSCPSEPARLHPPPAIEATGCWLSSLPPWKWQQCLCKLGSKSFTVLFHRMQMAGGYVELMRGVCQDPALQPRSQLAGRPDEPV